MSAAVPFNLNGSYEVRVAIDIPSLLEALNLIRRAFGGDELPHLSRLSEIKEIAQPAPSPIAQDAAASVPVPPAAGTPPAELSPQRRRGRKSNAQKAAEAAAVQPVSVPSVAAAAPVAAEPQHHLTAPKHAAPAPAPVAAPVPFVPSVAPPLAAGLDTPAIDAPPTEAELAAFRAYTMETFIPRAGQDAYTVVREAMGTPVLVNIGRAKLAAWRAAMEAKLAELGK